VAIVPVMVWRPFLTRARTFRSRPAVVVALFVSLGLASASTHWRLPDLKALPNPSNFRGTQEFDLLGVSACADRTYLPPGVTGGWPITPRQIRMAYDPRHLLKAMDPTPGVPRIIDTDAGGDVGKVWKVAVRSEFGCYLAHRTAVFVQQMGLARSGVFYPMEYGIIDNPYGLAPAHPRALKGLAAEVRVWQAEIWRRPFLLYLLAPALVAALWLRRAAARGLFLALLGGAFAYPALLFVAAPAADARYIFPSNVFCALILAAGAAVLLDLWKPGPERAAPKGF